ncbi:hypothetical protein E4U53_002080 [Claviceps sorghi]|nr:hypothetical protein E4U53_002080 [Claviceps sorghi]
MSTEPFVWVLIPLVVIFFTGTILIFLWNKKRREHYPVHPAWPEERGAATAGDGGDDAHGQYGRGLRWPGGSEARSTEGLNELGEAPPPYDAMKPPAIGDQHGANEPSTSGTRPRESGSDLPPGYAVSRSAILVT